MHALVKTTKARLPGVMDASHGRVLLVHPGTQYAGRLAAQLEAHGFLGEFHTCFAFSDESVLGRVAALMPSRWQRKLSNRRLVGVPPSKLYWRPQLEIATMGALRRGETPQDVFSKRNAQFQRAIPDAAIIGNEVVVGFDTSSWLIARRAREKGRPFVLDQSIGHPRSFARVATRLDMEFPAWAADIAGKSEEELRREEQEHADATLIVVPSKFAAETLQANGVDPTKIRINPFGVDLDLFQPATTYRTVQPFRFVFAGSLQARKGLPLLIEAWAELPANLRAELWIVGGGMVPLALREHVPKTVRFLGKLAQAELVKVLHQCHVFVFPSYFEGLAQVQIEAAACGLPVIGTRSSGCEEIIEDGETGFILPTGDRVALRSALVRFISNPELSVAMRRRLLAQRNRLSWNEYGQRWANLLEEVLGGHVAATRG